MDLRRYFQTVPQNTGSSKDNDVLTDVPEQLNSGQNRSNSAASKQINNSKKKKISPSKRKSLTQNKRQCKRTRDQSFDGVVEESPSCNSQNDIEDGEIIDQCKKHVNKFSLMWLQDPNFKNWLVFDPEKNIASCKVCNNIVLKLAGGKADLKNHMNSAKHKSNRRTIGASNIAIQINDNPIQRENDKKIAAEIELVLDGIDLNMSFRQISNFVKRRCNSENEKINFKDIKLSAKKIRGIVTNVIAPSQHSYLIELMNNSKWALLVDEGTDRGKVKSLALVVRIVDDMTVKDYFYGLLETKDGTGKGLFEAILKQFGKDQVNYKSTMIGYASDGANLVAGNKEGLAGHLKREIPNLFQIKCVCHSMALCASHACEKLSSTCETLVKSVYNYIRNNFKKQQKFDELLDIYEIEPLKLINTSATRWLSLEMVVKRTLLVWKPLQEFFTRECSLTKIEKPQDILDELKNPFNFAILLFLNNVLPKLNRLNKLFQSESPKLSCLTNEMSKIFRQFLNCIYKPEYISGLKSLNEFRIGNARAVKNYEDMQLPIDLYEFLEEKLKSKEITKENYTLQLMAFFRFYETLCDEIRKRFDFDSPILKNLEVLNPNFIAKNNYQELSKGFRNLIAQFPNLVEEDKRQCLIDEYQEVISTNLVTKFGDIENMDSMTFWLKVFDLKYGDGFDAFSMLQNFVKSMMCLPHSTASVERIFSTININKSLHRTCMRNDTLSAILRTKQLIIRIKGSQNFKVNSSIRELFKKDNLYRYIDDISDDSEDDIALI